jgi:hypothetical protein
MFGRELSVCAVMACLAFTNNFADAAAAGKVATKNSPTQNGEDAPLEIRLDRGKVVMIAGKQSLQSASSAKPGEILQDLATYTNKSSSPLRGVEATLPVPANTELIMETVRPASARYSLDGVNFFPEPMTRKVKQSNGVEVEQTVASREYRFLRWYPGELAPKQSVSFSAQFRIAENGGERENAERNLKK